MDATDETILRSTLAWCTDCGAAEFARIAARADGVFMERLCPVNGAAAVKIARDPDWYAARMAAPRPMVEDARRRPARHGCPLDCGPCRRHTGRLHLPVLSITNDCNLDCPICFTYNRPDRTWYQSLDETRRIIGHILDQTGGVQLINLTGGEPTLHPDLFAILDACRCEGIGRVTMNTNGIRIGGDRRFAERIRDSGVQVVLSLDTLDPVKSRLIHGQDITRAKAKCLETLEAFAIPTTLLPVCIKGVNEPDVAEIVHHWLPRPCVRSITVQNMTFTGANGSRFAPREHITLDEVEDLLAGGAGIDRGDFFPLAAYHPLCYSAAYYIVHQGHLVALARLLEPAVLAELSADSYLLAPRRDLALELRTGLDRLWAAGADARTLETLRAFITALYPVERILSPAGRQAVIESWVKPLLIHPHMDGDTFDLDRVSACGDLVPDTEGAMIPACAYNLLYRQRDPRFWYGPG